MLVCALGSSKRVIEDTWEGEGKLHGCQRARIRDSCPRAGKPYNKTSSCTAPNMMPRVARALTVITSQSSLTSKSDLSEFRHFILICLTTVAVESLRKVNG